jgi:hypothetical protein
MLSITAIDVFLREPKKTGEVRWGRIGGLAMRADLHRGHVHLAQGLMGYVRSGLRQHWHVYGIMRHRSTRSADAGLRDEGRLDDRAPLLRPDRRGVLDREPADRPDSPAANMMILAGAMRQSCHDGPRSERIGVLMVATTGSSPTRP